MLDWPLDSAYCNGDLSVGGEHTANQLTYRGIQ